MTPSAEKRSLVVGQAGKPDLRRAAAMARPQPRGFHVTREGWYWLFATASLMATGLFKGINLITLLACLMAVVWVLPLLRGSGLRRLAGRRLLEEPVFAGEPFTLEAELENLHRRDRTGLVLTDQAAGREVGWPVPLLPARATTGWRCQVTLPRRGRYQVGPLAVSTSLPFGLVVRGRVLEPARELVVLPRLGTLYRSRLRRQLGGLDLLTGRVRNPARRHPAGQDDLHGLRSFRSGDSPRWIHWPTTARKGELMVREFEEMPSDNLIVVFDPTVPGRADSDEGRPEDAAAAFEEAVSLAATVCWDWCRQTGDRLVLAVAGPEPLVRAGPTNRAFALELLRCLAVQEPAPAAGEEALAARLAEVELPPAAVLLVSAGPSRLAGWLQDALGRPVHAIDTADPEAADFYERGDGHAG